jgi:hypothetical protein
MLNYQRVDEATLFGANGEAFASAVQGAKGLGEDPVGASLHIKRIKLG